MLFLQEEIRVLTYLSDNYTDIRRLTCFPPWKETLVAQSEKGAYTATEQHIKYNGRVGVSPEARDMKEVFEEHWKLSRKYAEFSLELKSVSNVPMENVIYHDKD